MSEQAALRYAKALFELADEKGQLDAVNEDLNSLAELLQKEQSVRAFFYSVEIGPQEKQKLFDDLLSGKTTAVFLNFLKLLFQKNRESIFAGIVRAFSHLYDKKFNRMRARIVTAIPVDEQIKKEVAEKLSHHTGATIILEPIVNVDLLGGFQLEIDDQLFDASIRRKLTDLKAQLLQKDAIDKT